LDNRFQVKICLILGFQLVQDKIVRIMANTQAVLLMCFRMSKLIDDGKSTMGQIAMTKAWVT
jgi:alkylation response protein AidB-like acyl-CoA dehydrogenase